MGMPCSWDGKVSCLSGYQGIPQSHSRCSSLQFCFRERFPSASVTTPLLQGCVSPAKLLELCQGRRRVTALSRSPLPLECNKSAPLGNSFPGKAVPALVKVITTGFILAGMSSQHNKPHSRDLLGRKKPGGLEPLGWEATTDWTGYRAYIKFLGGRGGVFQSGLGLVGFCSLFLGQTWELVGFCAQGLEGFCSLILQAHRLVRFQALVLGSSQDLGVFPWPCSPYIMGKPRWVLLEGRYPLCLILRKL